MKELMIYDELSPLNLERHAEWSVKTGDDFSFAREVTSVPLTAVEFRNAAVEFPIVFAEAGDDVMPVALMGIPTRTNLYIGEDGRLKAHYIPAFFRRYPFVFSSSPDSPTLTLCIDEKYEGINQDGRGERLFDVDGEQTQYLKSVLGFQQEYQAHFVRTKAFCSRLKELDLLEPMTARIGHPKTQPISLTGFQGIRRETLYVLPTQALQDMSRTGELELAYVHLQSLANFQRMAERMPEGVAASSAETEDGASNAETDDGAVLTTED
ncbi:MAG: SapC family protein [Proteobacteria bacterium]|nr:SapC family protein [Pseudomonadota bacterium]